MPIGVYIKHFSPDVLWFEPQESHNLYKILPFPRIHSHFLHLIAENLLWENRNNFPFDHTGLVPWLIKPTNFLSSFTWYTTSGPKQVASRGKVSFWNSWEHPMQYICHYSWLALSAQEQDDFILSMFWVFWFFFFFWSSLGMKAWSNYKQW